MFLVGDQPQFREKRIREFLSREPAIAVLLAAAHFEWTVSRAIMFLSRTPNKELRERLMRCNGLGAYKDFWRAEVLLDPPAPSLPEIVRHWSSFTEAFDLRHGLIHGRDTCTRNTATPKIERILEAASDVRAFCSEREINLNGRMPIRRKTSNRTRPTYALQR